MKYFILLLHAISLLAYTPTPESLFRGAGNVKLDNQTVAINFKLKVKSLIESSMVDTEINSFSEEQKLSVKVYIAKETDRLKVLQLILDPNNSSTIKSLKYIPNISIEELQRSQGNKVSYLYSLIMSIFRSDGSWIINFFKNQGIPFDLNSELINKEKQEYIKNLIDAYQNKESDPEKIDTLQGEEYQEINTANYYNRSPNVKPAIYEGNLVWEVFATNFDSIIDYETRHLKKVSFNSEKLFINTSFDRYLVLGANYESPSRFLLNWNNQELVTVEVSRVQIFEEKNNSFQKRLNKFFKSLNSDNSTSSAREYLLK